MSIFQFQPVRAAGFDESFGGYPGWNFKLPAPRIKAAEAGSVHFEAPFDVRKYRSIAVHDVSAKLFHIYTYRRLVPPMFFSVPFTFSAVRAFAASRE